VSLGAIKIQPQSTTGGKEGWNSGRTDSTSIITCTTRSSKASQ